MTKTVSKVSDFSLIRFHSKGRDSVAKSSEEGAAKYIAPELLSRNYAAASVKSDVYSFGMLLLEMLGGLKNVDPSSSKSCSVSLIYEHLIKGRDLWLGNMIEAEGRMVRKLWMVGLWSIQGNP